MEMYSKLEEQYYSRCFLCPRKCGVNRLEGEVGFCKMGALPHVARAALHFWEEPCISQNNGSGAIFFSGCNLQCVFCQNWEISRGKAGLSISKERLAEIFMELQEKGANNINLVTGVMFIPTIVEALCLAKEKGFFLPVIYNCGGYESVASLRLLDGFVDVYLPDFKCISDELGRRYFGASDYSKVAKDAIKEMLRQTGRVSFEKDGCIKKGVIVRHLVLPGQRKEAEKILEYLYHEYGEDIYFSILNQYTPIGAMKLPDKQLQRHLTTYEYQKVIDYALSLGITKAYMQIGKTAKESFIPAFDLEGIRKEEKQQGMDIHGSE